MSNDPLRIHIDKVTELIRGLGLDPFEPNDIKSVTIDPRGVEVVRYRRDPHGTMAVVGYDEVATETVTIGIEHGR